MPTILDVKNIQTVFSTRTGTIHAVNGVSFSLNEGETLGVVGESGCGKSVTMLSLFGLIPNPPGKIISGNAFYSPAGSKSVDLCTLDHKSLRNLRGSQISFIFQDPMTSFNPVMKIGFQVAEPLMIHKGMSEKNAYKKVISLFEQVGIPSAKDRIYDYPYQFSGGMRQRAMIAMALACDPKILIADEPTTALDVTTQLQITEMVKDLREQKNMSMIWITHDLGLIAGLAHRMIVMYGGLIVEEALVKQLYNNPLHPYTQGLLRSLPGNVFLEKQRKRLNSIEGSPPIFYNKPFVCPFSPRCSKKIEICEKSIPPLTEIEPNHRVACWIYNRDVQK